MIQPKLIHLMLCDSVSRGPDGQVSLIGLINRIDRETFPAALPSCTVYCRVGYGDGDFTLRFVVRGPDGEPVYDDGEGVAITLDDVLDAAEVALQIDDLPLPEPGAYWVEAWLDGFQLPSSLPVYVDRRASRIEPQS